MGAEVIGLLLALLLFLGAVGLRLRRRRPAVDEGGLAAGLRLFLAQALAFQPVSGGLRLADRAIRVPFLRGVARIVEGEGLAVRARPVGVGVATAPGGFSRETGRRGGCFVGWENASGCWCGLE